jgi:hypothetical protein
VPAAQGSGHGRKEEKMQVYRNVVVLALIIALPLAGCAAIQRSAARDMEQLLAAAGFQAKPADTLESRADLRTMPPRQLVARPEDGNFAYTYADPDYCQCLYVGGPKEYAAYQRLAMEEKIRLYRP